GITTTTRSDVTIHWERGMSKSDGTSDSGHRPLVGTGVLVVRDGHILLGKRRNAHGAGDWSPPGGHLEFGETPEDCAIREVLEETGLTITNLRLAGVVTSVFPSENKHYVTLFLVAECPEGDPVLLEPHKCEGWEWHDWANLPEPLFLPFRDLLRQGFDL